MRKGFQRSMRCVSRTISEAHVILAVSLWLGVAASSHAQAPAAPQQPVKDGAAMEQITHLFKASGGTMRVTISSPNSQPLTTPANVVIVFPPGAQSLEMERVVRDMLAAEATRRGWIVVTPQPPEGRYFFRDADALLRTLLKDLDATLAPIGERYHVACPSNGGRSSFAWVTELPDRTASVLTFPGILPRPSDAKAIPRLKGVPIRMFVGETDEKPWHEGGEAINRAAAANGLDVRLTRIAGEAHVIRSLTGAKVMDELEELAKLTAAARANNAGNAGNSVKRAEGDGAAVSDQERARDTAADVAKVGATLDAFHAAAAKADGKAYFDLFAEEGVFIGTDASERWTVAEFRAYAEPHFSQGKGWVYTPRAGSRHVAFDASGNTAWFDELLDSASYGTSRGTGVLVRSGCDWKIAQYALTFPMPNDLAKELMARIRAFESQPKVAPTPDPATTPTPAGTP